MSAVDRFLPARLLGTKQFEHPITMKADVRLGMD